MSETRPGAAGRAVGFIGWRSAGRAVYHTLALGGAPGLDRAGIFLPTGDAAGSEGLAPSAQIPPAPVPRELRPLPSVEALMAECSPIFIDMEPGELDRLLPVMRLAISDRHVLVLIGAGLTAWGVSSQLPERKLIRCLISPLVPAEQSSIAYYPTAHVLREEVEAFRGLFGAVELLVELGREEQFEVVRGLAGVAPAVLYTMADAMADGALMMGLPRREALPFISAILLGAARNLGGGEEHPALLREKALEADVAAAGLMEFESAGMRGVMMRVVEQAIHRTGSRSRKP